MTKKSQSNQAGVLRKETTEPLPDSQSTNAVSRFTSDTSATTQSQKTDSQHTVNFQDVPNAVRLIQALAGKLGKLVFWRKIELGDGEEVFALCFPVRSWEIDSVSSELKQKQPVLGELGEKND